MFIKVRVINFGDMILNSKDIYTIEPYFKDLEEIGSNIVLRTGREIHVEQSVTRIYKYLNKEKYYQENKKRYFRDRNSGYQPKTNTEVPPDPPTSGSNASIPSERFLDAVVNLQKYGK